MSMSGFERNIDLSGKKAMVCGSTAGIGLEIAKQMASCGARVTLVARNQDKLAAALSELSTENDQNHDMLVADFSDPEALRSALETHVARSEDYNILVNNTGGPPGGKAIEANTEAYLAAFNAHLICNQILASTLVEGMKNTGYGRIINIISTSVKIPLVGLGVSNTVRGAVANWSKTLSNELGPFGITVNNVLPGATETGRLTSIISNKAQKSNASTDVVSNAMLSKIPAGRFAQPWEVAAAATFLASPLASYINGINVPVDGGRTGSL